MSPYTTGCGCGCGDGCGLERVRFFPRQLLGAEDMMAEQRYFREKQRRHNRYLHGWGVVHGCEVRPAPAANKPHQVLICPGYVITPLGDEIMIGAPALFDVATCMVDSGDPCAMARPCPPVTAYTPLRSVVHLAVCYKECEVRPVRVGVAGCGCDDAECDYSRIRDAYEFSCLDTPPPAAAFDCDALCRGEMSPLPPAPTSNWVVLATIRINGSGPVTVDNVTHRRTLYSTAMLQAMGLCQCGDRRQPLTAAPDVPGTA